MVKRKNIVKFKFKWNEKIIKIIRKWIQIRNIIKYWLDLKTSIININFNKLAKIILK